MFCTKMMCFRQELPKCLAYGADLQNLSITLAPDLSGDSHWDSGTVNEGGIGRVHMGDHSIYCGVGVHNADCKLV